MNPMKWLSPLAMGILFSVSVQAQIGVPPKEPPGGLTEKDRLYKDLMNSETTSKSISTTHVASLLQPSSPGIDSAREDLAFQEIATRIAYDKSQVADYRHTEEVFEWQLTSSRIIFWIVVLIVLSGLLLSWLQFARPDPYVMDATKTPVSSVLKFSFKGGIEVISPVLGVLILVISLAFFYLYLVEVYQIRIVK
jgi:hypothetical protein